MAASRRKPATEFGLCPPRSHAYSSLPGHNYPLRRPLPLLYVLPTPIKRPLELSVPEDESPTKADRHWSQTTCRPASILAHRPQKSRSQALTIWRQEC